MKELPKDPLDVTFGNDSGCCIFVPNEIEKMQNGWTIPFYLYDPHIRLFSIYRDKKQRIGLVIAFETFSKNEPNVLCCNSLELSRIGIVGGRDTIKKLTDYVEDWLIRYAQEYGYFGVTMGSHSYNTAFNYSSRGGDTVKEELVFAGFREPFYSEIFVFDKNIRTRPDSNYWLWKAE